MLYTTLTKRAMKICVEAHAGQKDKDGLPYMLHPIIVADHVKGELETCVALLHDVVEDTPLTLDDLRNNGMPDEVVNAVSLLTHEPGVAYMDYIAKIKKSPLATAVKLQDLTHNMDINRISEPTERDIERVKKYKRAYRFLSRKSEFDHPRKIRGNFS